MAATTASTSRANQAAEPGDDAVAPVVVVRVGGGAGWGAGRPRCAVHAGHDLIVLLILVQVCWEKTGRQRSRVRLTSLTVAPTLVHVAPHPDDEAVGCPGALLHLLDRGWNVVSVTTSLGFESQRERRRAEAEEAATRAGFVPVFMDPPLSLDLEGDLALATRRVAEELPAIVEEYGASIVVSPSPHDVHHGHEAVGRGVQRAFAVLPPTVRWWMWGVWGDLPAPNVFYAFDQGVHDRALHILDAYAGELERNDYRTFLTGRAQAIAVMGSERVFGFGSPRPARCPMPRW